MGKTSLKAKIFNIEDLVHEQTMRMFQIYSKYYEGSKFENFSKDLAQKDKVILLIGKNEIQGFSTILNYRFELDGKSVQGVFSGDTIIESEYWGGSTLQMAFIKYMLKEKIKNPISPLYWFLISKGYKTYLLMANNFKEHYPRYEEETPEEMQEIMHEFALSLYPQNYDPSEGLIKFQGTHDHLKDHVAPITEEMKTKNPRIQFFAKRNDSWEEGSELVCLARFDLGLPFRYGLKTAKKMAKPLGKLTKGMDWKPSLLGSNKGD